MEGNKLYDLLHDQDEQLTNDPELKEIMKNYLYNDVYQHGSLDLKLRQLILIVVDTTNHTLNSLKEHVIGAINAAFIAQGDIDKLEKLWQTLSFQDLMDINNELVENIAGVLISSNMVYATSTVAIGTEIKVRAIVDGVASNVFSLYVTGDLDAPIIPAEGEPSGEEFIYSSDSDIDGDVHSQAA